MLQTPPLKFVGWSILTWMIAACAPQLTQAGSRVQLMKSDPPVTCKEIGPVEGLGSEPKVDARNKAAAAGANYLRLELVADVDVKGTAYRCPE